MHLALDGVQWRCGRVTDIQLGEGEEEEAGSYLTIPLCKRPWTSCSSQLSVRRAVESHLIRWDRFIFMNCVNSLCFNHKPKLTYFYLNYTKEAKVCHQPGIIAGFGGG